jgi:hypothetical protein
MHHWILVKIKDNNVDDAENILKDHLEESVGNGKPYDYVGDLYNITTENKEGKSLLKENNCTTLEQLEQTYINKYKLRLDSHIKELNDNFIKDHYKKHMTKEQAPLFINNEDLEETAKKILKAKKDRKPYSIPTSPEKMIKDIVSLIFKEVGWYNNIISTINNLSILSKNLSNLWMGFDCHDAIYVDMTSHTKGENTYFFYCDRHF